MWFSTNFCDELLKLSDDSTKIVISFNEATDEYILEKFLQTSNELKLLNILQLLMDGPNINWAFLQRLVQNQNEKHLVTMLFLSSSRLLVINGVQQASHKTTQWRVQIQLKSFYGLFMVSLAQRFDYINFNECQQLPKKICSVRWVKNVSACQSFVKRKKITRYIHCQSVE